MTRFLFSLSVAVLAPVFLMPAMASEETPVSASSVQVRSSEDSDPKTPAKDPLELIIRPGKLQVRWNEAYPSGDVFLYDLLGNKLMQAQANDAIDWNIENLKTGVYFVVWKDGRNAFTKKFLYRQD